MKQTSHPFISANGAALGSAIGPAYESHVEAAINTVRTNSVGAALRRTIQTAWVIVPYTGKKLNAYAHADNADRAGNTGHRRYNCLDATPLNDAAGLSKRYTKGGATTSTISFTPRQWMTSGVADHQHKSIMAGARQN